MSGWFESVESLAAGVLLAPLETFLQGYPSAQQVLIPAADAVAHVYSPGTTSEVDVLPNPDGSGVPLVQPLTPDTYGRLPGYVAQPVVLDLVWSSATVTERRITIGSGHDRLDLLDVPQASVSLNDQALTNVADAVNPQDAVNRRTGDGSYVHQDGTGLPANVAKSAYSGGLAPIPGVKPVANVLDPQWGGKADAVLITDAAMTSGSNVLSSAGQVAFTDADIGKYVVVQGAGATITGLFGSAPGPLVGYITFTSSGAATLMTTRGGSTPASASATVSGMQAAYGSGVSAAAQAAQASGYQIHLPAGSYMWDSAVTTTAAVHLSGDGPGRTVVYYGPTGSPSILSVTGPGLTGATATPTGDIARGAQAITVGAMPAGLKAGDYILLSSADVFDATESATTCGEFLRVQGISGNTLALFSPVSGPNTYFAASTTRVQKVKFVQGCTVEGLDFVNPAPEIHTEGFATPATQTVMAGVGQIANFNLTRGTKVSKVRLFGWVGQINLVNSIDFSVTGCNFKDGARTSAGAGYGYAVGMSGSQWGFVSDSTCENSHAMVNMTGTGLSGPINMPTRYCYAIDCHIFNGNTGGFVCHNASAYCDFIDCTGTGGPLQQVDVSHDPIFEIVGHYCKVINPVITDATGIGINLAGDHCEVFGAVIRGMFAWQDRCSAIRVATSASTPPGATTAGSSKVRGFYIDGVKAAPGTGSGAVQGFGIVVASSTQNTAISHGVIRNTANDGIFITDTSGTTRIDDVAGEKIGDGTFGSAYLIGENGTATSGLWTGIKNWGSIQTAVTTNPAGLSGSAVLSATVLTATNASWTIPTGATMLEITCVGGGGGGGGGGSATSQANQVGGAGGTAGAASTQVVPVGAASHLAVTIGTGGAGGTAGASGGFAGGTGGNGGNTTVTGTGGIFVQGGKGGGGKGGALNSAVSVGGANYGGALAGQSTTSPTGGQGGAATSSNGLAGGDPIGYSPSGGQGGGPTTATVGGAAGSAGSKIGTGTNTGQGAVAGGGASGGAGVPATDPGAGGGGGGGGAFTGAGAGGAGGAGAAGFVIIRVVG